MKIAIPLTNGQLSTHFGHCEEFGIYEIEVGKVVKSEKQTPPPHEPGVFTPVGCMKWASRS
ncbi:MAG: NifB/NifX family molybdenum-iron cluster-binding protein [bacterium]